MTNETENKGRQKAKKVVLLHQHLKTTYGYTQQAYSYLVALYQMYEGLGMRVDFEAQLESLDALVTALGTEIRRLEDKIAKISLRD